MYSKPYHTQDLTKNSFLVIGGAGFIGQHKTSSLIRWSSLSASSYYYQSKPGKRGRSPSSHTLLTDGNIISNESIVIAIRFILAEEFVCFGYDKITDDLRANQFIINPKKHTD